MVLAEVAQVSVSTCENIFMTVLAIVSANDKEIDKIYLLCVIVGHCARLC